MVAELCAPVDVQIEMTQACNWRCCHCYNFWRAPSRATHPPAYLSRDALRHIIRELAVHQVPSITITGGEPFIRRDEVFTLLRLAREAQIHVSINTNFSLVKPNDVLEIVREHQVSILASVLSPNAAIHECLANTPKGSHAQLITRIADAIHQGLSVGINMVLVPENLPTLRDAAFLAKEIGARSFCATKVLPNARTPDRAFLLTVDEVHRSLAELMDIERSLNIPVDILGCFPKCLLAGTAAYRRFYHRICVAGCTTVTIGADGEVRPCSHMEQSYGNILVEPLASIWQKMRGWRSGEFIPERCRTCTLVAPCRGGCRVNTLAAGLGNLDRYAIPERLDGIAPDELSTTLEGDDGPLPEYVVVDPGVKFRAEPFGAMLYRNDPWTIALVNRSAAAFLNDAARRNVVLSFRNFLEKSGAVTDRECRMVEKLYRKLVRKNILTERR